MHCRVAAPLAPVMLDALPCGSSFGAHCLVVVNSEAWTTPYIIWKGAFLDSLLDRFTIFPCAHALAMIRHDDFDQWLYGIVVVVVGANCCRSGDFWPFTRITV